MIRSLNRVFLVNNDSAIYFLPMTKEITKEELQEAYEHSRLHRDHIEQSGLCGCFLCFNQFCPSRITQWIEDDQTALCPICFLDGVLPANKNAKWITTDFLKAMRYRRRF